MITQVPAFLKGESIHLQGGNLSNWFASILNGVYSKTKEFAPFGSKFFPLKEAFSKSRMQTEIHKSCPSLKKWWKFHQVYRSPK